MNKTAKAALDAAIREDHPCSDSFGCDIEVARANGFTEAAAYLLTGATETPAVDRVTARYGLVIGGVHSPAFDRWYQFHRRYGRKCGACESYMYDDPDTGDRASRCTNCMAPMEVKYDWDVDSAIWQAKNGTPETQRTESAWVFVEAMACGESYSTALEMANDPEMLSEHEEEED